MLCFEQACVVICIFTQCPGQLNIIERFIFFFKGHLAILCWKMYWKIKWCLWVRICLEEDLIPKSSSLNFKSELQQISLMSNSRTSYRPGLVDQEPMTSIKAAVWLLPAGACAKVYRRSGAGSARCRKNQHTNWFYSRITHLYLERTDVHVVRSKNVFIFSVSCTILYLSAKLREQICKYSFCASIQFVHFSGPKPLNLAIWLAGQTGMSEGQFPTLEHHATKSFFRE